MDIDARNMNGRALAVVVIALAIFAFSWAGGRPDLCREGGACAVEAPVSVKAARHMHPVNIGASVHIVDPNAPHDLAIGPSTTSTN